MFLSRIYSPACLLCSALKNRNDEKKCTACESYKHAAAATRAKMTRQGTKKIYVKTEMNNSTAAYVVSTLLRQERNFKIENEMKRKNKSFYFRNLKYRFGHVTHFLLPEKPFGLLTDFFLKF